MIFVVVSVNGIAVGARLLDAQRPDGSWPSIEEYLKPMRGIVYTMTNGRFVWGERSLGNTKDYYIEADTLSGAMERFDAIVDPTGGAPKT